MDANVVEQVQGISNRDEVSFWQWLVRLKQSLKSLSCFGFVQMNLVMFHLLLEGWVQVSVDVPHTVRVDMCCGSDN